MNPNTKIVVLKPAGDRSHPFLVPGDELVYSGPLATANADRWNCIRTGRLYGLLRREIDDSVWVTWKAWHDNIDKVGRRLLHDGRPRGHRRDAVRVTRVEGRSSAVFVLANGHRVMADCIGVKSPRAHGEFEEFRFLNEHELPSCGPITGITGTEYRRRAVITGDNDLGFPVGTVLETDAYDSRSLFVHLVDSGSFRFTLLREHFGDWIEWEPDAAQRTADLHDASPPAIHVWQKPCEGCGQAPCANTYIACGLWRARETVAIAAFDFAFCSDTMASHTKATKVVEPPEPYPDDCTCEDARSALWGEP